MNRFALLLFIATGPLTVSAQTSVGVSIGINQPGVYGRVEIGNLPPPPVILARPVLIERPAVAVAAPPPPVYIYAPPGHQKHWAKHCASYGACGQPVYFVREGWVRDRYEREHGDQGRGHGKGKGKGKGHGHDD